MNSAFPEQNCAVYLSKVCSMCELCDKPKAFFFFWSFVFLGPYPPHMQVPRQGSNQSFGCRPTPQSQQLGIRAAPVSYTTAHGSPGSLTH